MPVAGSLLQRIEAACLAASDVNLIERQFSNFIKEYSQ
jgi:hypothetical protein